MRKLLIASLVLLAACAGPREALQPPSPEAAVNFVTITDSLEADPAMVALVVPYAQQLEQEISEVVGFAADEIREGRPEGPLGTFAAEAMLAQVQERASRPVQMALTNNGGLRVPLSRGEITVGRMFELMPFENMMVILDLSAAQVDSLAQQLARVGGDPIAGFSFVITEEEKALDVRVAGEPLQSGNTYRLVTSDYLANGGGPYEVLWGDLPREELAYLLRDAFIDHLREIGTIEPVTRGLIQRQ